jgi:L-asparaginase
MPQSVRILITGGTIDKTYDPIAQVNDFKQGSQVGKIIGLAHVAEPVVCEELYLIDSTDMTDEQRLQLTVRVSESPESCVLVTHGTDTMVDSARAVARSLKELGLTKTVVFVGSMRPYSFSDSDASFNMGFAYAASQIAQPGIYVAMNGTLFPYDMVQKDYIAGKFVS